MYTSPERTTTETPPLSTLFVGIDLEGCKNRAPLNLAKIVPHPTLPRVGTALAESYSKVFNVTPGYKIGPIGLAHATSKAI